MDDRFFEFGPGCTKVRVEMPGKFLYGRQVKRGQRRQVNEKMAINVGGVIREAELIAERFRDWGYEVDTPQPVGNPWKENATLFKQTTGYKKTSNEYTRDAAWLVYGLQK